MTRKEYLDKAAGMLRHFWDRWDNILVPPLDIRVEDPTGKGVAKVYTAECYPMGDDGKCRILMSPRIREARYAVAVLGHEMIHAADDCISGHGRGFQKIAKAVGYGKGRLSLPHALKAQNRITDILHILGEEYPTA